jgi:Zn-dependent peptidase ImmA (M78 family)
LVRAQERPDTWEDPVIKALADRFGASREAVLRRLLLLGKTTERFYRRKRDQFRREHEDWVAQRKPGFAPPHRSAVSSAGPVYTQIILANYYQENITASDVADFLDVKLKHLPKIEAEVFERGGTLV